MSLLHIFSLSNELLIEIISNLCPIDITSCRCTCSRLNGVIMNSNLIQYIMRTALSGVFDPLEPGPSLPDRLDALERWETAWMEMDLREPNTIINAPVFAGGCVPRQGFLYGQYLIMVHVRSRAPAFYSFLDVHAMSLHTNAARWTTIEVDTPTLVFTFAPELKLTVAISAPNFVDHLQTTVTISFLQFSTGQPHPLASQPKLDLPVSGSTAPNLSFTTVIGDYILYCTGSSPANVRDSLCGIYLVAWKEGWGSHLRTSPPAEYSRVLSVISEEIILLVRLREPALELCRLSNIDDREKASLETVRILYMPVLPASTSLRWTFCPDGHQEHPTLHLHPQLSSSSLSEGRIDTRRHLSFVPMDGIVVVMMLLTSLSGHIRMLDLTVRRRTLLEFCNVQAQAGAGGTGTGTGVGMDAGVPWEKWGPNKTRILEHDSSFWPRGSLVAGERCAMVLRTHIKIQDYNPFRVQRALKLFGGVEEVTLESGSVVKVIKEPSVHLGGMWFRDDIETSLPYVETAAPVKCKEILINKDNVVVPQLVRSGPMEALSDETRFSLHSLWHSTDTVPT